MAPDDTSFFALAREIITPREIKGPTILTGGPSAFSAEEWRDYDSGRPDRCSPDLRVREALRLVHDRDGE